MLNGPADNWSGSFGRELRADARSSELSQLRATLARLAADPDGVSLMFDRWARISWATAAAQRELGVATGDRLPAGLWQPVERALAAGGSKLDYIELGARRWRYRLVPDPDGERHCVHLARMGSAPSAERLRSLGLTRRQAEVLELAMTGKTAGGIADALYLSPRTVEKHIEATYLALGAHNRAEAIARVLEQLNAVAA